MELKSHPVKCASPRERRKTCLLCHHWLHQMSAEVLSHMLAVWVWGWEQNSSACPRTGGSVWKGRSLVCWKARSGSQQKVFTAGLGSFCLIIHFIFRVSEETESGRGSPGRVLHPFIQEPLYRGKFPIARQEVFWVSPLSPS